MADGSVVTHDRCHEDMGTLRSDVVLLRNDLNRIRDIVEGPPHPGLEKRVDSHITTATALEKEREKQHQQNINRLNIIIAILLAIAAYIAIIVSIRGLPKSSDVFHSQDKEPVLSLSHQPPLATFQPMPVIPHQP